MARKQRKKVTGKTNLPLPPRIYDYGTEELWLRCKIIKERVDEHTVRAKNLSTEWPIERYYRRGTLNDNQYSAAQRIYRNFNAGKVAGFAGSNWPDPSKLPHNKGNSTGLTLSEHQAQALRDFRDAYSSVNYEASFIVWHVVCLGIDIGLYEDVGDGEKPWRRGYGMTRLREALDDLVRFYKGRKN